MQQALLTQFQKNETPEVVWKDIRKVKQGCEEDIKDFIKRFEDMYKRLEKLGDDQVPPDFMKRDQFIMALHEDIKGKVDDEEPNSFERAKEVAIGKWRKRMRKLGRAMREDDDTIEGMIPYSHKMHEWNVGTTSRRESSTNGAIDLAQQVAKMAEELGKLNINQAKLAKSVQDAQQKRGVGRQNPNVQCYNCFEREHISPNCPHPKRDGGGIAPIPRRAEKERSQNQVDDHGVNLIEFKAHDEGKGPIDIARRKVVLDGEPYDILVGKRARMKEKEEDSGVKTRQQSKGKGASTSNQRDHG